MSELLYEKIINEDEIKLTQVRLVVNDFRGIQYLHLRKYYMDFDGDWLPSNEGISMPATIHNIYALLDGLTELCSKEEATDSILKHFKDKLNEQNS